MAIQRLSRLYVDPVVLMSAHFEQYGRDLWQVDGYFSSLDCDGMVLFHD
jgi:hypothetical protein